MKCDKKNWTPEFKEIPSAIGCAIALEIRHKK